MDHDNDRCQFPTISPNHSRNFYVLWPSLSDRIVDMTEVLAVPEENLRDVIRVIRSGLKSEKKLKADTRSNLIKWCNECEEYLHEIGEE